MKKVLFSLLLFYSISVLGQTKLPSFFSNNMVLQQNQKVAIWGTDKPKTSILVEGSWGEKASAKTDANGKWKVELQTPQASRNAYDVNIKGSSTVNLKNVLIGEVWICSGQSNMEMPIKGMKNQPVAGSNEAVANARNNQIRLFTVEKKASLTPLDDVTGNWQEASPASVKTFSATAYFFGKKLNDVLDIPIGLINTSWGGSDARAWVNKEVANELKLKAIAETMPKKGIQQSSTLLYNGMLHPLVGLSIKGVAWYQGESNKLRAEQYKSLFPALIKSWRAEWKLGDFPFYFVQIAPFSYEKRQKKVNAAYLREAQLQTMQTVKNTGMVVTADIGDCECIHPKEKKTVGNRLAYWALSETYGIEAITASGPIYREIEIVGNKATITFHHADLGFSFFGKDPSKAFEIAGEDKVFYPAKVQLDKRRRVNVWSDKVSKPVAVRYAFKNCVEGVLYNTDGLPASPFRTDNWKQDESY